MKADSVGSLPEKLGDAVPKDLHLQRLASRCSICTLVILPGEAVHGARGDHWDCVYPNGAPDISVDIKRDIAIVDKSLEKIAKLIKELR